MRFFGMELFQSGGTYSALPSVPRSEIILFEKDTVVLGYSLLTNATDGVIYYTSGSGAGGDAGGAAKPSGTWTISGLSGGAVTLTSAQCGTPSFTIAVIPTIVANEMDGGGIDGSGAIRTAGYGQRPLQYYTVTGSSASQSHSHTVSAGSSWRPTGRCVTRQQRV